MSAKIIHVIFGRNGKKISPKASWYLDAERKRIANKFYTQACKPGCQEKNPEIAEDLFKRSIKLNPELAAAYNELGNFYAKSGQLIKASEQYKKTIEIDPYCVPAYYNMGYVYQRMGQDRPAMTFFQKLMNLNPSFIMRNFQYCSTYVKVLERLGKFDEALKILEQYLEGETCAESIDLVQKTIMTVRNKIAQ